MFAAKKLQGAGGTGADSYWVALLGGTGTDEFRGVAVDSSNNIVAVGYTNSDGAGIDDCLIAKYDSSGTLLWARTLGASSEDYGFGVATDSADNIIIAGRHKLATSDEHAFLAKYNSSGTLQWQTGWGISGNYVESWRGVVVDSSDNIITVGYTTGEGAGNNDCLIAKYNSSGTLLWDRTLGGTPDDRFYGVALDSSENIIAVGYTLSDGAGSYDCLIAKYNSSGTLLWDRTLGGTGVEFFEKVAVDSSDNIFAIGESTSDGAGGYDITIAKYNSSGTLQWDKTFGGTLHDYGLGITTDSSGNAYACGYTTPAAGDNDAIIAKFDSSGSLLWCNSIGETSGTNADILLGVVLDSSGNLIFCGRTNSDGAGGTDAMLWKVPSDGTGTGTYGSLVYQSYSSLTLADAVLTDAAAVLTDVAAVLGVSTMSLTDAEAVLTDELLEITI